MKSIDTLTLTSAAAIKETLQVINVIDCIIQEFNNRIKKILSKIFQSNYKSTNNIYGKGRTSKLTVSVLSEIKLSATKKFVDMGK